MKQKREALISPRAQSRPVPTRQRKQPPLCAPFSVRRGLCPGRKAPGPGLRPAGQASGKHPGTRRGQGFSAFRQSDRRTAGISRLAGSARRLPCHVLPLPGATVQRFSPGIRPRHGNFLLVSRLFIPGRREQIPTKVPTKKTASSMDCRGSRRFMTDKQKESPRRRLQTAGNFYGFFLAEGEGFAPRRASTVFKPAAISRSAILPKNVFRSAPSRLRRTRCTGAEPARLGPCLRRK